MNIYSLPFASENTEIKAVSDPRVHFAHFSDAIDFLLPEGTTILAAADGEVVDVKVDSSEGGTDEKYKNNIKYLNYITIKHPNGEFTQYAHLAQDSNFVNVGDQVAKGQLIAQTGSTGYTTQPHIHFHVFKLCEESPGWKSIPVVFDRDVYIFRPSLPSK